MNVAKTALAQKVEAANDQPEQQADNTPVGVGYQFNFGGSGLEMQVVIPAEASLATWNATLDKMRAAGERQKTLSDLRTAENNIVIQKRERHTALERIDVSERDHVYLSERRTARIEQANRDAGEIETIDRQKFEASGKRGAYQRSQEAASRIARKKADIEHEMAEQARAEEEKAQALKGHNDALRSIDHTQEWWESEVVRLKALLEE